MRPSDPIEVGARHLTQGRTAEARAVFQSVLEQSPNHPRALSGLGAIALHGGDVAQAVDLFGAAASLAPDDAGITSNLGAAYARSNRPEDAETCFRRAIGLDPTMPSPRSLLAALLQDREEFDAAASLLADGLTHAPGSFELLFNLANVELRRGRPARAEELYRRAIEHDPEQISAWNNLANLLGETGRLAEALQCVDEALLRDPENPMLLAHRAQRLLETGRVDEAETAARRATALQPAIGPFRNVLGRILLTQGRLDQAMAELTEAARRMPEDPNVPYNIAEVLRRQGRLEPALIALDRTIALSEGPGGADLYRRDLLLCLERYEEALEGTRSFEAAAGLRPAFPRTLDDVGDRPLRLLAMSADTALFAVPYLGALAGRARLEILCPPLLAPLIRQVDADLQVTPCEAFPPSLLEGSEPVSGIDRVPLILGDLAPPPTPSRLVLPGDRVAAMRERLTGVPRPAIGIWWEGEPDGLPVRDLLAADGAGALAWVVLQTGEARAMTDLAGVALDLGTEFDDMLDLAVAVSALDMVVCPPGPIARIAALVDTPGIVAASARTSWHWWTPQTVARWAPSLALAPMDPADAPEVRARALIDAIHARLADSTEDGNG